MQREYNKHIRRVYWINKKDNIIGKKMQNKELEEFAATLETRCESFRAQPSLLDGMIKRSWISTTPYRGMYNLLVFLGTIGIGIDAAVFSLMKSDSSTRTKRVTLLTFDCSL